MLIFFFIFLRLSNSKQIRIANILQFSNSYSGNCSEKNMKIEHSVWKFVQNSIGSHMNILHAILWIKQNRRIGQSMEFLQTLAIGRFDVGVKSVSNIFVRVDKLCTNFSIKPIQKYSKVVYIDCSGYSPESPTKITRTLSMAAIKIVSFPCSVATLRSNSH